MANTLTATSIGQVAQLLQCNVSTIERIAQRLQLIPVLRLNYILHFNDAQIDAIRRELEKTK
jgi:hypothetical protein